MSTDSVCFWKSIHAFKEHTFFCMDLQPATDPYNVVCTKISPSERRVAS